MKSITVIGIILIVLGILGFTLQRVSFLQTKNVIDAGPIQVQTQERKSIPIPDLASGAAVAAGVILVIMGATGRGTKP